MFDKLRSQITQEMASHRVGVLSAGGEWGPQAMPVRYRLTGLEVECLLPRWSELTYELEESNRAVLVVLSAPDSDQRWIRFQGTAEQVDAPDWATLLPGEQAPADRYTVIRIRPTRIDLFDHQRGWGARETLDLA
jgi:hypothetical protein